MFYLFNFMYVPCRERERERERENKTTYELKEI